MNEKYKWEGVLLKCHDLMKCCGRSRSYSFVSGLVEEEKVVTRFWLKFKTEVTPELDLLKRAIKGREVVMVGPVMRWGSPSGSWYLTI